MSAYIKLATLEYPRHEGDIRIEHPEIGAEFACPPTYAPVEWVDPPPCDYSVNRIEESPPVCVDGKWRMVWATRPATKDELDAAAADNALPKGVDTTQPGTAPDVIG